MNDSILNTNDNISKCVLIYFLNYFLYERILNWFLFRCFFSNFDVIFLIKKTLLQKHRANYEIRVINMSLADLIIWGKCYELFSFQNSTRGKSKMQSSTFRGKKT